MQKPEFTPKVSAGDMITLVIALLAAAGFAWDVKGDVAVQSERIDSIEEKQMLAAAEQARAEARVESALREIKASLLRVEDKLDRKADK